MKQNVLYVILGIVIWFVVLFLWHGASWGQETPIYCAGNHCFDATGREVKMWSYVEGEITGAEITPADIIKALELASKYLENPNARPPNPCELMIKEKILAYIYDSTDLIYSYPIPCEQPTPAEAMRRQAEGLRQEADELEQQEKDILFVNDVLKRLKEVTK